MADESFRDASLRELRNGADLVSTNTGRSLVTEAIDCAVKSTVNEWDMDIPPDNRFHDPFSHFRHPEPLWTRLQDKCTNYEEAVRLVCVLRDLLLLVDNRRHASVTDFIRRAKYEEALQIIFGLRITTSEPYRG